MTGYWDVLVRKGERRDSNSAESALFQSAFDRAEQHRPQDRDAMRVAAVELRQRGLTPVDIAAALRLSEGAIRELLGETS